MSRFRPGRFLGVLIGTVVILGVGLYGPATLLGPLPPATATPVTPAAPAANPSPPLLPAAGASAVATLAAADTASVAPIAVGGSAEALPMGAITKIVTALVVLDAKPLADGTDGPSATISAADYQDYLDYFAVGARTVVVFPGEAWTERELLQAMLLGSSNNHADTLARWAFGSGDAYLSAAQAWLTKNGLTDTHVADATGLKDASSGTGSNLARLAGMAATDPVIAGILANPASALVGQRNVENTTAFLPDLGVTGISRSYTDAAGVCFLFTAQVSVGDAPFVFSGAIIGEPDYDTLTADVEALMNSAVAGVTELPLLAAGDAYARFDTAWGDSASAVVGVAKTRPGWQAAAPATPTVTLDSFASGRAGTAIGRVTVGPKGDEVSSPLKLDETISDPGAGWRLLHPGPLLDALFASR